MTSLSDIYGHEENLSKAIAASDAFEELLNICGVVSTDSAIFETRVEKGHEQRQGRIDIIQPTTAGIVIVEVQYGVSDNSHAKRLQNYALNFRSPAFVVWIAESFRKEHIILFEQAKTPVLCAKISQSEDGIKLKKASPIHWTKQSQAKRVRESHKKCLELMKKLFTGEPSTYQYQKGFIPMHRFFGAVRYQSLSSYKKRAQKDYYKNLMPRNKPIQLESNIEAIIEWYLQGMPKKTQFYLLKHPSFMTTKEVWKDEMACHWMLCNINNNHPYLDYSYLNAVNELPFGRNRSDVYRMDNMSRKSWRHTRDFFSSEPWYDFSVPSDHESVGLPRYIENQEYYYQLNAWIEEQRQTWKPGIVVMAHNIHRWSKPN